MDSKSDINLSINVPFEKDPSYPMKMFKDLSDAMGLLFREHGIWPDSLIFIGRLGEEMRDVITENGWDFSKFKMKVEPYSALNTLVIGYTKPFDQKDDGSTPIRGESLDGKIMDGIPGPNTVDSIRNYSTSINYSIERKIQPELRIKLIR